MAKNFNIELHFFTPEDVDFKNRTVNSLLIEGNRRTPKIIPFPKLVYNNYGWYRKTSQEIVSLIKKEFRFVRSGKKLSKQKMYDILFAEERFRKFLIETHVVKNFEHFLSLFRQFDNSIVLKPERGGQGIGIFKIHSDAEKYVVHSDKKQAVSLPVEQFRKFYEKIF